MTELPKESLENKTYKGVPLQRDKGLVVLSRPYQPISEEIKEIHDSMGRVIDKYIIYHVQQALPTVRVDEYKIRRWVEMCQFLEERASEEDKKIVGQWLYTERLREENEKLRSGVVELQKKIQEMEEEHER